MAEQGDSGRGGGRKLAFGMDQPQRKQEEQEQQQQQQLFSQLQRLASSSRYGGSGAWGGAPASSAGGPFGPQPSVIGPFGLQPSVSGPFGQPTSVSGPFGPQSAHSSQPAFSQQQPAHSAVAGGGSGGSGSGSYHHQQQQQQQQQRRLADSAGGAGAGQRGAGLDLHGGRGGAEQAPHQQRGGGRQEERAPEGDGGGQGGGRGGGHAPRQDDPRRPGERGGGGGYGGGGGAGYGGGDQRRGYGDDRGAGYGGGGGGYGDRGGRNDRSGGYGDRGGGGGAGGGGYGDHGGDRAGQPYNRAEGRQYGQGGQLQPESVGRQQMLETLTAPGGSSQHLAALSERFALVPPRRPGHGRVGAAVDLLANMFALTVTGHQLLQYDVQFELVRAPRAGAGPSSRGGHGAEASSSAAAAREPGPDANPKAPANSRDIIAAFDEQHWQGRAAFAYDGGRNLITARVQPPLSAERDLSRTFEVHDVQAAGRSKPATWRASFKFTRSIELSALGRLAGLLAAACDSQDEQALLTQLQVFTERRQPLEWALKQALLGRHNGVPPGFPRGGGGGGGVSGTDLAAALEVGRSLYFSRNPANRNVGGGLQAVAGLVSGIKLTERGLMYAADVTCSAFLRTDIDLVEWMADVTGCNRPPGGGGRAGGPGGRFGGGRGRGRGGGRSLPEVGPPDVNQLLRLLGRQDKDGKRALARITRALRGKKVVYKAPDGRQFKHVAVALSAEPADRATFLCKKKEGGEVLMSVAQYFAEALRHPLRFPELPVVEMKVSKGSGRDKIWVPPEHLWFDRNQRVQAVTHRGGTEQMIEAARKDPPSLAAALSGAMAPPGATLARDAGPRSGGGGGGGGGDRLLESLGLSLSPGMERVAGRILPGPWLVYGEGTGGGGREPGGAVRGYGPHGARGGGGGDGGMGSLNTGSRGEWNMNTLRFSDPARLLSWGLLMVLPQREFDTDGFHGMGQWVHDFIQRMLDLGMDLGCERVGQLAQELMEGAVWLPEHVGMDELENGLLEAKQRAQKRTGRDCQLLVCFIRSRPSPIYDDIKFLSELVAIQDGGELNPTHLGLVTQVVVAARTDLDARRPSNPNRRSQYQANLALKVNAKCGGVNTRWAAAPEALVSAALGAAPGQGLSGLMAFGIDVTHPGRSAGARSVAAVVGSIDPALCRYAHRVWEEAGAGSEGLTRQRLRAAARDLLVAHAANNRGAKPAVLLVYRDGVSDPDLLSVRRNELEAFRLACEELAGDSGPGSYRPRLVYVVVQKRHHVRLLKGGGGSGRETNVDPGTVVDSGIVSPWLFDFYLNSHKPLIGTSRCPRYTVLLNELGLTPDALQLLTHWLTFLYCRCTRPVSVVAPVYYAHLLAFRARLLGSEPGSESASLCSGSSGGRGGGGSAQSGAPREVRRYAPELDNVMFFV